MLMPSRNISRDVKRENMRLRWMEFKFDSTRLMQQNMVMATKRQARPIAKPT